MWYSIFAVAAGSTVGGLLRWTFNIHLNGLYPAIPPGTLLANLVGGYIVGLAAAYFATTPGLAPEWRLLAITGFCGGLTTFSSFSLEIVSLLQQDRLALALGSISLHLGGSLFMTTLGFLTWRWLQVR
jgi:CrcB protein